ncbi:MAG: OmpA/MotB family protein [Alphaproteobacteria bacterium]
MSEDLYREKENHDAEKGIIINDVAHVLEHSIIRNDDDNQSTVPLWLVTFTDVMALMLTFFVLLYAMSTPSEESWDDISASLGSHFSKEYARPFNKGSQDVVSIDQIPQSKALDLGYLETLVTRLLEEKEIKGVMVFQNGDRLIISLPSELLFESGGANINIDGKKALFSLAGALARIRNRLEVIGHTDPAPITSNTGLFKSNWDLSLARGSSVAAMLRELGYMRDITVRGVSSGRYEDLPDTIDQKKRYDMARRVDIVLMSDEGYRIGGHGFK